MSSKRILVTGGAGYIGSHAVRALGAAGFQAVIFDNFSTGFRQLCGDFEVIEGDIRDGDAIRKALHGCEAVMHFAAHAYVGESVTNPRKYYDNNVRGTLSLLDAVIDVGVKKFIFSSTCAVYGEPKSTPIDESFSRAPVNPYGQTKFIIENALADYDRAYGLRYIALRYFNAAGASSDGTVGEMHEPETHLIPLVLRATRPGAQPLLVFGDDFPTPDGTCVRDYIHVEDLADAHVRGLKRLDAEPRSDVFNLGTGSGYSVLEVIRAAEKVTGRSVAYRISGRRAGDPPALVASAAKAKAALGWTPQRDLISTMSSAWAWHQKLAPEHAKS